MPLYVQCISLCYNVILQALVDKQSPSLLRKQFLVQLQLLQPKDVFVSFITANILQLDPLYNVDMHVLMF